METENKPTFTFTGFFLCIALVILGCVVFSFMPDDMGILGWILFAVGTLLNVIGIFRMIAMLPEVQSQTAKVVTLVISLIAAVFIQYIGLDFLYNSNGSGKAIAITTLALCVSLGLIVHVVDFDDETLKKKIKISCSIITVVLVAIAIYLVVKDDLSDSSIFVGTILLIEAVVTGRIGFVKK